jgi:DNA anti-recombination protein RmuC
MSDMLGPALMALITLLGFVFTIYRFNKETRKEREAENEKILQASREYTDSKIDTLTLSLNSLEKALDQDIQHVRETYKGEIHNLTKKVEELREQIIKGHGELISLMKQIITTENKKN